MKKLNLMLSCSVLAVALLAQNATASEIQGDQPGNVLDQVRSVAFTGTGAVVGSVAGCIGGMTVVSKAMGQYKYKSTTPLGTLVLAGMGSCAVGVGVGGAALGMVGHAAAAEAPNESELSAEQVAPSELEAQAE
jgi:hypothetical protein